MTQLRLWIAAILAGGSLLVSAAQAQTRSNADSGEHWVTTWATAQQLLPGPPPGARGGRGGPPPAAAAAGAPGSNVASASAAPARPPQQGGRGGRPAPPNIPQTFADQTVRMVVRSSLGGRRVRVELSNMANGQPVEVGAAHVALHKGGGAIVEGTDRALRFGGNTSFTMQPGVLVVSDPVDLDVAPLSELAISLYFPRDTGAPTNHRLGLHTAYISAGNTTAMPAVTDATKMYAYVWLSSVDVVAPRNAFAVVALGDSITDGQATTLDADRAWPAVLARRLNGNKDTKHIAVVNQGISGNQVLRDGAGVSALARFDRDVLSRPGVRWVILLEGINDINLQGSAGGPNALTAEDLIWGYRQIIERCHMHGIRVLGATIMPEEGVWIANERTEEIRQAVNRWIRTKGNFDAVVDFDAVVRDPQHPSRLRAEFDPGDRIHPNDAGNQAMAEAIDLNVFKR